MNERTADQARDEYIQVMGRDLGTVYSELWQEVGRLYRTWLEYVELFGTKESRIALMNEAAPSFFNLVHDTLWESTLVHITRLTDAPKVAGKDTLTFKRLPTLVPLAIKGEVEAKITASNAASAFARDWRNRRIAHNDFGLAMKLPATVPLEEGSRLKVREALSALVAVLNTVSTHYGLGGSFFETGSEIGGAGDLLWALDDGVRAHRARQERLEAGKPNPDDLGARDV